jgi:hypothetical protein
MRPMTAKSMAKEPNKVYKKNWSRARGFSKDPNQYKIKKMGNKVSSQKI